MQTKTKGKSSTKWIRKKMLSGKKNIMQKPYLPFEISQNRNKNKKNKTKRQWNPPPENNNNNNKRRLIILKCNVATSEHPKTSRLCNVMLSTAGTAFLSDYDTRKLFSMLVVLFFFFFGYYCYFLLVFFDTFQIYFLFSLFHHHHHPFFSNFLSHFVLFSSELSVHPLWREMMFEKGIIFFTLRQTNNHSNKQTNE